MPEGQLEDFSRKKLGARIGRGASAEGVKPLAAGGPGAAQGPRKILDSRCSEMHSPALSVQYKHNSKV